MAMLGCDRSSDLILLLLLLSEILTAPGQTTMPSLCKKPEVHLHIISVKFLGKELCDGSVSVRVG